MNENTSESKRLKISGNQESLVSLLQIGNDATSTLNNESSPSIFTLNVDCFEEVFEWLALIDLLVLRRTCKRMKQVVDYYIKLNYPKALHLKLHRSRFDELHPFVPNVFKWTKHLNIWPGDLTSQQIEDITYIFNQIESLQMDCVEMEGDLYKNILKHCTHLRYLAIRTSKNYRILGNGNEWLHRKYPKLEHFDLQVPNVKTTKFIDLKAFFGLNPNIRIFSTDSDFLAVWYRSLFESNISFDRIDIRINRDFHSLCDVTNELYKNGFYKKLHIYCHTHRDVMTQVAKFNALEKLNLWSTSTTFDVPKLNSLTELSIDISHCIPQNELDLMARNFLNLKRLYIGEGFLSNIRAFVRFAVNLKQIIFRDLFTDHDSEGVQITDFMELNEDRKQLARARKITFFIDEDTFLDLKWNYRIHFSLIEIQRTDSCEKEHLFERI